MLLNLEIENYVINPNRNSSFNLRIIEGHQNHQMQILQAKGKKDSISPLSSTILMRLKEYYIIKNPLPIYLKDESQEWHMMKEA